MMRPDLRAVACMVLTDRSGDRTRIESVRSRGDGGDEGMTAQSEGGRGLAECGVAIAFLIIVTL